MNCCLKKYSQREEAQFQQRVGTHVEDDVDDARGATERLENREVEVEDDGGGEGPSETGADGQDFQQNSHHDEEETESQKLLGHHQTS
jgi:hypothetical protein